MSTTTTLEITSNGSKWAGQAPDDLPALLKVLAETPLDPTFEAYGNFFRFDDTPAGLIRCWGNFFYVSHVFDVRGPSEAPEMRELVAAIEANQRSAEYAGAKRAVAIARRRFSAALEVQS